MSAPSRRKRSPLRERGAEKSEQAFGKQVDILVRSKTEGPDDIVSLKRPQLASDANSLKELWAEFKLRKRSNKRQGKKPPDSKSGRLYILEVTEHGWLK